jgi:hypothetical protein
LISIFLIFSKIQSQEKIVPPLKNCQNIQGIGQPINIFHRYFQQTMNIFNPKDPKLKIKLIYYREQNEKMSYHRFVFKLKNNFAPRWEYVGIVSVVPRHEIDSGKYTHYIVRYLNSTKINDIAGLLGIYELEEYDDNDLNCPKMKEHWLSYLMKNPYMPTECRAVEVPGCVRSSDLTELFQSNFIFVKLALKKFGFEVSIGELGYNKEILSAYKEAFKKFSFINKAISQLEGMITSENEVDQKKLVITSDTRPPLKCEEILDLKEICKKQKIKKFDCLTEEEARSLINYMIIHFMIDTRTILPIDVIRGKITGFELG